jgi:hypothetical protein
VLTLIKTHLKRLVVSEVDPAEVGILVGSGLGSSSQDAATPLSPVEAAAAALRGGIARDLAARGDVTSSHTYPRWSTLPLPLKPGVAACKAELLQLSNNFRAGSASAPASSAESTLAPVHRMLQFIIEDEEAAGDAATKAVRSRIPAALQATAADAIDAGLQVLYPTQAERRQLLAGLVSKGGVVEVQFRFPAMRSDRSAAKKDEKKEEKKDDKKDDKKKDKAAEEALERKLSRDPRADRAVLLLELECDRLKLPCVIYGQWGHYVHVVIDLPTGSSSEAVDFLDKGFSKVFERAGFGKWTIPTGCNEPNIPLKIERVADFSSPDRSFTEGVGVVHIYPRAAACYEDINTGVQTLVSAYAKASDSAAGDGKGGKGKSKDSGKKQQGGKQ